MPLFKDRLRADAADYPNRQSLLFFGTGFVDVPSGRVFVPLVGRQRWAPSKQDELAYQEAFPSVLFCYLLVVLPFCVWNIGVALRLLPEVHSGLVLQLTLIGAAGLWFWRRAHLVRHWPRVDPGFKRSKLVLASLKRWSVVPLSLTFALLVALGMWLIPEMFLRDEGAPPALDDPELWVPLAVLALLAYAYFRAILWLGIALAQRALRSSQARISRDQ
jgi:hypothetical protein